MQKGLKKTCLHLLVAAALVAPGVVFAQEDSGDKKEMKEKKQGEQITIIRQGDAKEKLVVEIDGDKVTVNGKEIKDGAAGDVTVSRNRIKDMWSYGGGNHVYAPGQNRNVFMSTFDDNRAMLGVTTDKDDKGAIVRSVYDESGAAKAGIKEGDIITKVDDKKIEQPDDLSNAIRNKKPGEKVNVTFLRDKKEMKASAELTKWKGVSFNGQGQNFNFDIPDFDFDMVMPSRPRTPRSPDVRVHGFQLDNTPKLGLSVQDSEDGKGVAVLEADEDGNAAKAGIKEGDIITEVDGTAVNGADEIAKLMKASKSKQTVKVKLLRKGKTETVEVKIPKKLKTAEL